MVDDGNMTAGNGTEGEMMEGDAFEDAWNYEGDVAKMIKLMMLG